MNIRLCPLIIVVLAALSTATMWAQSTVERFDRIDRNRDGKVIRFTPKTARRPSLGSTITSQNMVATLGSFT